MNIEQTFSDEALHRSSSQCQGSVFMEFLTYQKTCVSVAAACIWCRQSDRPNCWRTHWLLPSGKIDGILKQELLYNLFERRCIKKCSALLRLHVHTSCLIWQFDELFCCGHPNKQILKSTKICVVGFFKRANPIWKKKLIWRTHLHWVNEKNK